ncbi:putative polysaccharide biosynthesis protein [Companilactobacillus halodurans]|uniref:Polysaccharide biosynthesis protein n=1 Tax=Companilactobacillus halodurans TaxID=2584183 RepID=A0A5P0ZV55_9LACO|nr:polysaccharide biosynthesis protein [Companilactobacillus halodurans]MQS96712.1 polysaccharide biosynthesis protein [Companilactobacillus halodurans]
MQKEVSRAIKGTWILTIASLFSELLSAIYRIPLQNIVGDRGYFIYQQVYPLYGIFSVLALSGLPVVISKTFAQQDTIIAKHNLLKKTFNLLLVSCVVITGLLWFYAKYLAFLMGDPNLYPEVRAVSLAFLLVPFEASLRGYFQSNLIMEPSAISQVSEQLVRIVIIIGSALLFGRGVFDVYKMGTWANSGAFIGGIFAVFILVIWFLKDKSKLDKAKLHQDKKSHHPIKLEHGLVLEVVLIVVFTGITIFYQFIDSFSMLRLLMHAGINLNQAEIQKGIFDRGQPLLQLGIVLSLSFVSTIMPQLKETNRLKQNKSTIQKMVRVCLWLSVAETAGLIALMPQINTMLFTDASGSKSLAIYMLSIMIVSFINLLIAVTSGDDEKNVHKLILFGMSLLAKIALNIILIPKFGIAGGAMATVLSECVILFGILIIYNFNREFLSLDKKFILSLIKVGLIMAIVVKIIVKLLSMAVIVNRPSSVLINIIAIPIGALIYLSLTKHWQMLTKEEWEILPMGKYITKFMKIRE